MSKDDEKDLQRPDLYIGMVCAAGTDLTDTRDQIQAQLAVMGYKYRVIKVSSLIAEVLNLTVPQDEYERIRELMRAGDIIREKSTSGNGVAAAIIAEIRRQREGSSAPESTAYIIDSLKNPSEIALLDQVYGRNYYTVSVFLPKEDRIDNLKNKIAKGRHQPPEDLHKELAEDLAVEDEKGSGDKSQNVQETFPKADFFINGAEDVPSQTKRFVELVFGKPFATPTPDEYFMFMARAAALRSCDLSRQVGAVIVDKCKAIVATGCNEVPYPGGGIFYEGREGEIGDNRDYTKGHDPNYIEIQRTLIEFIDVLKESGHVQSVEDGAVIADGLLHGRYKELMSNARIRNLIEFGRVVHAEMHALSQAAAVGRSVDGSVLYCTTFPCHGCARHIIAAGVREVVFIEPYPKSLTAQLYSDEIEMSHQANAEEPALIKRVRFRPFHGIAPILYQRVFSHRQRKDRYGTIVTWNPKEAIPVGAVYSVERPKVETAASNSVAAVLESAKAYYTQSGEGESDGG